MQIYQLVNVILYIMESVYARLWA